VVDSADPSRVEEARAVLQQLLSHPDLAGIPVLLLANKQDAPTALTPHEIEASFALQQILDSTQPRQVFGTAAVTGEGVKESISWLVETLRDSPRAQGIQPY